MFELGLFSGFLIGVVGGLVLSLWIGYWKVKQKLASLTLSAQELAIDTAMVAGSRYFKLQKPLVR